MRELDVISLTHNGEQILGIFLMGQYVCVCVCMCAHVCVYICVHV